MSELLTVSLRVSLVTLWRNHFSPLYPSFFRSLPKTSASRWGSGHRSTGKSKALSSSSLFTRTFQYIACWHCTNSPVYSHPVLLSLVKKTPGYLNSFAWGNNSLPTQRVQSTIWLSSHPLHTRCTRCVPKVTGWWRHRKHIICKKQRRKLRSCPWISRTDKGQPWQGPTPTGNVFYILNAENPDSALTLVTYRMVCIKGHGTPYSRNTARTECALLVLNHLRFNNGSLLSSTLEQTFQGRQGSVKPR